MHKRIGKKENLKGRFFSKIMSSPSLKRRSSSKKLDKNSETKSKKKFSDIYGNP